MLVRIQPILIGEFKDTVRETANSMGLAVKDDGLYFAFGVYKPRRVFGLELPSPGLSIRYYINHDGRHIDSFDADLGHADFKDYVPELQRRLGCYSNNRDALPEAV